MKLPQVVKDEDGNYIKTITSRSHRKLKEGFSMYVLWHAYFPFHELRNFCSLSFSRNVKLRYSVIRFKMAYIPKQGEANSLLTYCDFTDGSSNVQLLLPDFFDMVNQISIILFWVIEKKRGGGPMHQRWSNGIT